MWDCIITTINVNDTLFCHHALEVHAHDQHIQKIETS